MRRFLLIVAILLLFMPLVADYDGNTPFLATAISVSANSVKTLGSGIASHSVPLGEQNKIGLTCIFTPAGTSSATVDFYFQVSYDGGDSWAALDNLATSSGALAEIPTNFPAITGSVVSYYIQIGVKGASHIRWNKVDNNDTSNALSDVNVVMSY